MVALFIQNTKEILISLLYFGLLSSPKCDNQPSKFQYIENYLKLELTFTPDTVKIGEKVKLNVAFINKTDSTFQFYPKSVIYITKPFIAFGIDNAYPIRDTLDVTNTAEIKPRGVYICTYDILIDKSFFEVGENTLILHYRCKELQGKRKVYNGLFGSLNSKEFKFIVLPEL